MASPAAKAAKQRRKEIQKSSREAAKRRKELLKENQKSSKSPSKNKKRNNKPGGADGIRLAIAKAFPTFASALKVKPADLAADKQSRPKKEFEGRTPSVNLLPPEYTVDRAVASTARSFSIAAVGVIGSLGVIYFAQGAVISIADETLRVSQAQTVEANLKTQAYTEITALYDELGKRVAIIDGLQNNSPEYFAALTELYRLTPQGTNLQSINVEHVGLRMTGANQEGEGAQAIAELCGPPIDPFVQDLRPVSACIAFAGNAPSITAVYALTDLYRSSALFSNIVIEPDGGAEANGSVNFRGTGAILAEADVSKVLLDNNKDLVGEVNFGDEGEENVGDVNEIPPRELPDGLTYEPGLYTINDNFDLVSQQGEVIATSSEFSFPFDSLGYVVFNGRNYPLDSSSIDKAEDILYGDNSGNNEEELLEPLDPNSPEYNGYVISETGDIIDPLTGQLIYRADEYTYREESDVYIVIGTGQPIQMADIYYRQG